jgi:hypothetical protein
MCGTAGTPPPQPSEAKRERVISQRGRGRSFACRGEAGVSDIGRRGVAAGR